MFNTKRLPHCENLTREQYRLAVRLIKNTKLFNVDDLTSCALQGGGRDVVIAALRNDTVQDRFKGRIIERVIQYGSYADALAMLGHVASLDAERQGSILHVLIKLNKPSLIEMGLRTVTDTTARVNTAFSILSRSELSASTKHWLGRTLTADCDVHYMNGVLMKWSVRHDNFDMADLLIERGFDLSLYAFDIKKYLDEKGCPYAAHQYLEERLKKGTGADSAVTDGVYERHGDTVVLREDIGGGDRLTTVFNFTTRQQIIIVQVNGQPTPPAVVPFDQIPAGLDAVTHAFVAAGGSVDAVHPVLGAGKVLRRKSATAADSLAKTAAP